MSSEQTEQLETTEKSPPRQGEPTLGEQLRRARSAKGVSLEEAAAATRVHVSSLKALEENNPEALPAPTFTRGFVRIYAAYLDLDPDEALRRHIEEQGLPATTTTEKINIRDILATETLAEAPRTLTGNRVFLLLLLMVAGFIAYWSYTSYLRPTATPNTYSADQIFDQSSPATSPPSTRQDTPDPEPATALTDTPSPPIPSPMVEKDDATATDQEAVAPEPPAQPEPTIVWAPAPSRPVSSEVEIEAEEYPHVLVASFVEDTWLRLQIDHGPSRQLFFRPGDSRTWEAKEQLELRIGNAGGVELSYNGEALPPLGASGEVANISFP